MLEQCLMPAEEEDVECSKVLLDFDSPSGLGHFEDESVDLVTSNLSMHWVNDLPGLFKEVNRDESPPLCVKEEDKYFLPTG